MAQVLIQNGESPFLELISAELEQAGHECVLARDGLAALRVLEKQTPDLAIVDERPPDTDVIDLIERLRTELPEMPVLIFADPSSGMQAVKTSGAVGSLQKPLDSEELLLVLDRELRISGLRREVEAHRRHASRAFDSNDPLGQSSVMQESYALVERLSEVPGDTAGELPPVLIEGEIGTGKSLLARQIHARCGLKERPFVEFDCSELPRESIGVELFGREKAEDDAIQGKAGLIEIARGGSIFLKQISELPTDTQTELVRAFESKRARRVGGTREYPVDVRFLATTDQPLRESVRQRTFRSDLYYLIKTVHMRLPPLRERPEDIPLLTESISERLRRKWRKPGFLVPPHAVDEFQGRDWPGNVRELSHLIEQLALSDEHERGSPHRTASGATGPSLPAFDIESGDCTLEAVERRLIEETLEYAEGNVSETSRLLGISRGALRHRLAKWAVEL